MTNTPTSLRRKRVIALPLLLSVALAASAPSRVAAQDAYGCVDELDDDEVARRTSAIAREFRSHERHARAFRFGWMSLFAVFAVAEFACCAALRRTMKMEGSVHVDPCSRVVLGGYGRLPRSRFSLYFANLHRNA